MRIMRNVERVYCKLTTVLGDAVEVWIALIAWPERIFKAHGRSPEVIIRNTSGFGCLERQNERIAMRGFAASH